MAAAAAAAAVGLPPGFKFLPSDGELIRYFLLPHLQGQALPVEGLFLEDDPTKKPPWMLLERNGRGGDDDAYFLSPASGEGRQPRSVVGGGRWITQRTDGTGKILFVDGETVEWQKVRLNFHYGEGRSGSTGWVMHEYAVVKPAGLGASHRLSHIAFTGHGQRRKRVPDGYFSEDSCKTTAAALPPPPAMCYPQQHPIPPEQSTQNCFQPAVPYDGEYDPNQERFLPAQNNQDRTHQERNYQEQSYQEHQESDQGQPNYLLPEQNNQEHQGFAYDDQSMGLLPEQSDQDRTRQERNYLLPQQSYQELQESDQGQPSGLLPEQNNQERQGFAYDDQPMDLLPEQSGQEFEDDAYGGVTVSPEDAASNTVLVRGRGSCFMEMTEADQQQADDMAMQKFLALLGV